MSAIKSPGADIYNEHNEHNIIHLTRVERSKKITKPTLPGAQPQIFQLCVLDTVL
jgi:hypothetical protein